MSEKLKFAEMLCTRFCHDIIGPVGAVSNGAEFLRDELKDMQSQAADLIESSAKEAVARVQFYRQAYGFAPNSNSASLTEMKKLTEGYFMASKIKLEWSDKYTDMLPVQVSQAQKKLILNLLIISASTLIRGGRIHFEIENGIATITATGDKLMVNENLEKSLTGNLPAEQLDPRLIQAHYTYELATDSNLKVEVKKGQDLFSLAIKL